MIALVTAIWGTLSGPMVEWGVRDLTVKLLGMDLFRNTLKLRNKPFRPLYASRFISTEENPLPPGFDLMNE